MKTTSMEGPHEVKHIIIREFYSMIEHLPDNDQTATIQKLVRYLQGLLRIKQVIPPVVEIMTLIKKAKPTLYSATRRTVAATSNLHMLFQVDMDPVLAEQRMRDFIK
ncbi:MULTISPECIES: hypothetical protein [Brevibacillus]|uniref:Uncharacterized protein n=1 Tax=Brevibacillus borstelensis AK1 TaxID=1300222 RepID=M8DL12_9BACL|nr:hypothetical protein [Brevibacillus borstelensis]EMT54343.1 hypothetical protein I532_02015 [Brevibacillus borstelensis AK1]MBE5398119.1 hypothetical protein [Brevibacillus borstelensis]MCC0564638.1 hypothetical protein [Brevibacillus borstelensis]MCM3470143.1 hypothetical protein [Brevibacillus borstelensis]MCM3557747.1 hypothetical protein [Brevibacillus borstelensis]